MRIPDGYPRTGLAPVQSPARPAPGRAAGDEPAAAADESDRVSVSARSRELSLAADGVDAAKVARLRSSIEAGTFRVDAREIAERIARGG